MTTKILCERTIILCKSPEKEYELLDILRKPKPSHNQRLYLVGFLKYIGYSFNETCQIIKNHRQWSDYDENETQRNVKSIYYPNKNKKSEVPRPPPGGGGTSHFVFVDPFNQKFFENAMEIAIEYAPDLFSYRNLDFEPENNAIYRTIEGKDHILLVLDIDFAGDLERAWRVTKKLMRVVEWDIVKFSGKKGFHLIKKMPNDSYPLVCGNIYGYLSSLCKKIINQVDMEGIIPDENMFHRRRLIKGFCKHLESGLYSIPVSVDMTVKDILSRAKLCPIKSMKGGENNMAKEWQTVGLPYVCELGYGKFLEITKRSNGDITGISIASGQYSINKDGNKDTEHKQYRATIFISDNNGAKQWLLETIQKL